MRRGKLDGPLKKKKRNFIQRFVWFQNTERFVLRNSGVCGIFLASVFAWSGYVMRIIIKK